METIKNNRDFLFLYQAKQNNPNGDPDQENKPRMDYDTKTNLVTDVRLKRFIRDYLKSKGEEVFVSLDEDAKVSPETKLINYLNTFLEPDLADEIFGNDENLKKKYVELFDKVKGNKTLADVLKENKETELNRRILAYLIAKHFTDVRMFGSAFAVKGFTYAYTGSIQINWGYSLNEVYLMDSNSIVTIMSDETSTFGKDYRIWYSLIAFYGTINENAAKTTFLTDDDIKKFRDAIWNGITALPTRTKQNQFPLLYLEIEYREGLSNGQFGDLRQYIKVQPVEEKTFKQVRDIDDLIIDFSQLEELINNNDKIEHIYIKTSDLLHTKPNINEK